MRSSVRGICMDSTAKPNDKKRFAKIGCGCVLVVVAVFVGSAIIAGISESVTGTKIPVRTAAATPAAPPAETPAPTPTFTPAPTRAPTSTPIRTPVATPAIQVAAATPRATPVVTPIRTSMPIATPEPTKTVAVGTPDPYSIPYKLAVINNKGYVAQDDRMVGQFTTLLKQLEAKCVEGQQEIADSLVKGQEIMATHGMPIGLLDFTKQINGSTPEISNKDLRIAEVIAAYIVLRSKGFK